ncbi:MAG: hypothetical protein U0T69_07995 [Chitinophagales bacterium]
MNKVISYLLIILLFTCIYSCNTQHNSSPKKPKSVPNNAFWIGGEDGGNWYSIVSIDSTTETVHFIVYNDYTGEIELNKNLNLNCSSSKEVPIRWQNIESYIDCFDGKRIILNQISLDKSWCYFE